MDPGSVPGLDLARVAAWLAPEVGGLDGPLTATVVPGGRSNLTYVVADGGRRWVLRRPPLAHVLPTAHDMVREHRVLTALRPTAVPVPATVGLCRDESVTGAPFYVMEHLDGVVVRGHLPDAWADTEATRGAAAAALVRALAAIHAVLPEEVGLGDFGRPAGYLGRQLRRWWQQWELSATRPLPGMEQLRLGLEKGVPQTTRTGIVHGDFRLDNLMYDHHRPEVIGVLDWEMCTLGDPLADLGLLLVYWSDRRAPLAVAGVPSTVLTAQAGFPEGSEVAEMYAMATGADVHHLDWYVALGFFKLAVVAEGIHARYLAGMTVGEGFETMGSAVPPLVERALERLGAAAGGG